ncbi:EamA family transporter [Nocardioides zeae]|uniref:Drug/metabolite transporter (DMT)-like permease n=1 Tax=Nocardioides zeae TaxID=1457234 RepID=A0AAJ1X2A7_9ACTN|nr:EamA family transporter [Nocardioides zeae]MDQ1103372.1 drug/metabolite transporter (DMT)-like permease [Nocardioides zeae]
MSRRDALLALLVALLWGFNFVVIERGMDGIPPLLFLALRFVVVVVPAVLLVPRPDLPWTAVARVGVLMSLGQFGFLYASMHAGMPPGLAALVLQAQVLLTIVIAAGVLGERPSARQGVGVLVGSLGLAVVAVGRDVTTPLPALLLCLAGALSWAAGNVAARAAGAVGGLSLTVWSALVVPVPALGLSLLLDGPAAVGAGLAAIGVPALLSTLYTAVLASLVGYGIFTGLLGRYPAGKVVPWILLVPPVAMTSAWLLRGDRPAPLEVAGGLVLLAGAAVALLPERGRRGVPVAATATVGEGTAPAPQRSGASTPCRPDSV